MSALEGAREIGQGPNCTSDFGRAPSGMDGVREHLDDQRGHGWFAKLIVAGKPLVRRVLLRGALVGLAAFASLTNQLMRTMRCLAPPPVKTTAL